MAGLYIHIPFCKQACSYCNFHFSTRLETMDALVDAIIAEMNMRSDYLSGPQLDSVYFGGGTPSLLSRHQLDRIWRAIECHFDLSDKVEITLEANPDDLHSEKLVMLADTAVNRLSIGVQSFRERDLVFMHRAHNAVQAKSCLTAAIHKGFDNLSIDLIYGIPGLTDDDWEENLRIMAEFPINHLSCYALTVEPRTLLAHQIKTHQVESTSDEHSANQFKLLMEYARDRGWLHYEISNFAKPGFIAVHNGNYWKQEEYLGLGPSAHSYNGVSRSWNVANNAQYVRSIGENVLPLSQEKLEVEQVYNEYIMTGLRTIWGCSLEHLASLGDSFSIYFQQEVKQFVDRKWVFNKEGIFTLTDEGKLFADHISSELFMVESP
ncbi:MAG: radical SAM family heme chaperone HemW [Saprospiraceae bacterium]|nr:radical SAM family heme chaperone HemW [Saprospiraceae bacterium]